MKYVIAIGLVAALALAGTAYAGEELVGVAGYYVGADGSVWEETNDLEGLQTVTTAGPDGELGTEDDVPPDTRHL